MDRLKILVADDDLNDIALLKRAFIKAGISVPLQSVRDGQEAIDYLSGVQKYSDRSNYPLPDVIFLDLKLPYVHGFEVLSWLRQQPALKEVAVIILTSSPEERDRQRARELRARSYLVKPPTRDMLLEAMQSCCELLPA